MFTGNLFCRRLTVITCIIFPMLTYQASAQPNSHLRNRHYYEERGDIVWDVPTEEKALAFTFDDGPDEKQTLKILEVLEKNDAKATFFVVGSRVKKYPDILKKELAQGHEVGNHTYHHPSFQNIAPNKVLNEISETQDAIFAATGHRATFFRPPGGQFNEKIVNIAKENKLQLILWSWHQDTKDWASPGVQTIVNRVLKNVRNGDIILMHDCVYHEPQTAEALSILLPELKKRGYSFVTVSQLLAHRVAPKTHIKVSQ